MIHLSTQDGIRDFHKAQSGRIADNYNRRDVLVEKAISIEEFVDQYPIEKYQIYSPSAINKFVNDFAKSENVDEELLDNNLSELEEVLIKGEDGSSINVFVRKIEGQQE